MSTSVTWQVVEREAQDHDPSCNFYMTLSASIFKWRERREEYSNCKCLEDNEGASSRKTGFVKTKLYQTSLFSSWIVDKGTTRTCYTLNILQKSLTCHRETWANSYCYTVAQKHLKKHIQRVLSSNSQWKCKAILSRFVLLLVLITDFF